MDFSELIVLLVSGFFTYKFFYRWLRFISSANKIRPNVRVRVILGLLPAFSSVIVLYTLISLASFDVAGIWVLFYLLLGFAWLHFSMFLLFFFFDISWIDDVLGMNNPAAALAVFGGGIGATFIYAGANIGDGPGWWCVILAGGLGIVAFTALGILVNFLVKVSRRITINRDIFCGFRTCAYFISGGIILGRASAGDWTSFGQTIVEFASCYPVIFLTAAFILTELLFINAENRWEQERSAKWFFTLTVSAVYIAAAILAVIMLPPLPVNPIYTQ